jgi:hypothetical protein
MFEKFTSIGATDFKQRYQGTYGIFLWSDKITGEKKRKLVRLDAINTDRGQFSVTFVDSDGSNYTLLPDTPDDYGFEFLPPRSAYYNTRNGEPWLIKRIASKQYSRGLCDKNTHISNLVGKRLPTGFEIKTTITDALKVAEKVLSTSAGIALSSQFSISFVDKRVRCFESRIGTLDEYKDGKFYVSLENPELWGTEIRDAFRRANLEATVV